MTTVASPSDNPSDKAPLKLLERMAGDMKIRHLSPQTIKSYCRHVKHFAQFIARPLEEATAEDIRSFQLYMIETRKLAWSSFNQAVCSLRFFYRITLPQPWPVTMIPYGKRRKHLPTVLSQQEVEALLKCSYNRKHRTLIMLLYATGLRISEATSLMVSDIDSQRMQLKVTHGKGNRMRMVPFSPRLLAALREYWTDFRPKTYLFPGQSSNWPIGHSSMQEAVKRSAAKAKLNKVVTPHTLRHSYATAMLEAGVDLMTISRLLGHASFSTAMLYLHVRQPHLQSTPRPLDWLPVSQLPTWQQRINPPSSPPERPEQS